MLEKFIVKNVEDGETKLMEIINTSPQLTIQNNPLSMHSVKNSESSNVMKAL